ncbi:MAG: hypothetical protein KTV45_12515 [Acidimicrobiia bacterium]|nr:hypothetical protein [Acidimicrobiia bacterium]
MPPAESLARLVALARRRLWAWRFLGEISLGLGIGATGAAAVWGVSRVVVFPWADGTAVAIIAVSILAALGWWAAHRPSSEEAALWADHRLGGEDRLATAWELSQLPWSSAAATRQGGAAGQWASAADPRDLRQEYLSGRMPRMLGIVLTAVLSAAVLAAAPSVTDQALAESRVVREVVDREVEAIETMASESPEELARRLTELADQLGEAQTLEEALTELSTARLELEERLGPNRLAENTALQGLAARLSRLPGAQGEDPASQLEDLASSLGALSSAQRQAIAQELADRATDFAGINDELAAALEEAASALAEEGLDPAAVADAVGQAAAQLSSAQQAAEAASFRAAAAARLDEAEARLRNARQGEGRPGSGEGQGSGQGQGDGSGQGQGQGQGEGSGQGQGQGQGQGSGQGQGQGSGQGAGAGGGGQTGASGVGAGTVSGVGDNDPARDPLYSSSIFEPPAAGLGEEVHVPMDGTEPGEVVGSSRAPSVANAPLVPYTERFAEYRSAALESLQRQPLPSYLTEVVQSYFTELEP